MDGLVPSIHATATKAEFPFQANAFPAEPIGSAGVAGTSPAMTAERATPNNDREKEALIPARILRDRSNK
jgi:hypothetical protein